MDLEDHPLAAVDQLACGVGVPGVGGRLGDDMQHDVPEVWDIPVPPPLISLRRRGAEWRRRNDGIRSLDLVSVQVEDVFGRFIRLDLPGSPAVARLSEEVERLAGHDAAEPVVLDVQGQMLHQAQATPPRRQDRLVEVLCWPALENAAL